MPPLLVQFAYLQALDILTTLAFLTAGVQEANPFVRWFFEIARSPLAGLMAVKALAIGMALYCWKSGRSRLLGRINILYALTVAWNLVALIAASASGMSAFPG